MKWLKFGFILTILAGAVYGFATTFVSESKNFTIQKEINYPVDKVFPQFNSLQQFVSWSSFISDNNEISVQFYSPYKGQGSSMSFQDKKNKTKRGDLFIRYENPLKTLKYQLFVGEYNTPYLIDLKFVPNGEKTKVIWFVETPNQPLIKSSLDLISEDYWDENIGKSMKQLERIMANKIDKEFIRENLKYDTLMVEQQESQLLVGINATTKNVQDALINNIIINHNKAINYVTIDMAKKDDEFGEPVLITDADNYKDKEVSYFYGIPVSKKEKITDNNFSFKVNNSATHYVIFYKGSYANRVKSIQQLLLKAQRDSMRIGTLQQTFLDEPIKDHDVNVKLSLEVFK